MNQSASAKRKTIVDGIKGWLQQLGPKECKKKKKKGNTVRSNEGLRGSPPKAGGKWLTCDTRRRGTKEHVSRGSHVPEPSGGMPLIPSHTNNHDENGATKTGPRTEPKDGCSETSFRCQVRTPSLPNPAENAATKYSKHSKIKSLKGKKKPHKKTAVVF